MKADSVALSVVMYHYVRDLPRTAFPRIKGLLVDNFRQQVSVLRDAFEMATLETAIEFLNGKYRPSRSLCLLTFDDGLKEHYSDVTPILRDAGIQGLFLIHTAPSEGRVAAVHKNHFLLAVVDFKEYRRAFMDRLARFSPEGPLEVDVERARRSYRWDTPEVARFKYLANFLVPETVRCCILDELFEEYLGDEGTFARDLHLNWDEAREMQASGMLIGGHSHAHASLTNLSDELRRQDLTACAKLLREYLRPQELLPFSYPYGNFDESTIATLHELGFSCSFTTEVGYNVSGADLFRIRRIDPKDAYMGLSTVVS